MIPPLLVSSQFPNFSKGISSQLLIRASGLSLSLFFSAARAPVDFSVRTSILYFVLFFFPAKLSHIEGVLFLVKMIGPTLFERYDIL